MKGLIKFNYNLKGMKLFAIFEHECISSGKPKRANGANISTGIVFSKAMLHPGGGFLFKAALFMMHSQFKMQSRKICCCDVYPQPFLLRTKT